MSTTPYVLCYLSVIAAGVSVALQQILNANLRTQLGSPWWAAFISYLVGTLVMLPVAVSSPTPQWAAAFGKPNFAWLSWTGGFFGAIFIATAIFMIPRLGAATVLALLVAGQMLGSLTFDHFGILGIPRHALDIRRVMGAILLVLGVVFVRM